MVWAEVKANGFPGVDGFLGTRASFMLDVVFLAMLLIVPVMLWSVYLVKYRRNYALHKRVQLVTGLVLLIAVVAFEIDIRMYEWEPRAEPSPFFEPEAWNTVWTALTIHLVFAIPTPLIWLVVIMRALKRFPDPPEPGPHSKSHRCWGYSAVGGLLLTAITGWIFYCLAFVAS